MTVHQIEEFYLHVNFNGKLNSEAKNAIEGHLSDEGYSDYEFQEEDSVLVVDSIPSEHEGETLEDEIKNITG